MFLIPTSDANDWRQLLADPEKHWKPGYSAFELAHRWSGSDGFPPEVAALLDQDDATRGAALPTHQSFEDFQKFVRLQGGNIERPGELVSVPPREGIALYFGWATGPVSRLEPTS